VSKLAPWRANSKNPSWNSNHKSTKSNSCSSKSNRNSATRNSSFKTSNKSSTWNCNQNWKLKPIRRRCSKGLLGMRIKLGHSMSRMIKTKVSSRPSTQAWTNWEMKIRSCSRRKMKLRLGREHRAKHVNRKKIDACNSKGRKKKKVNKSDSNKNSSNRQLFWPRDNVGKPWRDKRQKKLKWRDRRKCKSRNRDKCWSLLKRRNKGKS